MTHLPAASQLFKYVVFALYSLGAVSAIDLFLTKRRILLHHIVIPIIGLCLLAQVTVLHPRMYQARLDRLSFLASHNLYLLHVAVVWLLWILFSAWVWALTGKLWVFVPPFLGATYHSIHSSYFVLDA